jgi:hypothetical protein
MNHPDRFFVFDGNCVQRTFVNAYSTRVTAASLLRRLLARAGVRLVGVYRTDDGSGLYPVERDDPLPMAVAKPNA